MERKEVDTAQFIDHTLLASELILPDPNNFIMDLIDHTGVFPKAEGPTTGTSASASHTQDALTPELNFHNTIFQFVNKHVDVVEDSPPVVVVEQVTQPAFPALTATVPIDEEFVSYNAQHAATNARKVLPHKKRISRKLKGNCLEVNDMVEQHKQHVHVEVAGGAPSLYSCELCGYAVHTQLDFFEHLKEHYERTTLSPRLVEVAPGGQQKEPLDMCGLSAQDKLQQEQAKLDQVFHDVQLNFENFHNISHVDDVDEVGVVSNAGVNLVMHAEVNDKPASSTSTNVPPHVVDDVEFSDTEDMLEGIRNVVDKVSIEDTCDELVDLELTSSGMRAPWFNNNFSDIAFSGLLLPGEPPPASAEPPPAASLKEHTHDTEQIALDFLKEREKANEMNERALLITPPPPPPPLPPPPPASVPTDGSSLELLQRSPLDLNDSFKLEQDDEMPNSRPPSPLNEDGDEDNHDSFHLETDKTLTGDDSSKSRRKYFCDKCGRDFNSYNALKYHQYTHNQQRTHKCATCERSFYTQSALNAHERTHSGVKPFKCEQCDYKFRQWGDLKYHLISRHTDIKAHMCEFCGKSFSRRYSLVLHRRIHTSERNYACEYCDKTFRASSYLLTHIKVHTGERPYKCATCEKTFRVSGDLKRHSRIHDPARKAEKRSKKENKSKLKQIEDEDDVVATHTHKSDAMCDESEQEILGL